jgi:hypothetical protein
MDYGDSALNSALSLGRRLALSDFDRRTDIYEVL